MPRWASNVPMRVLSRRYFPRRSTLSITCPGNSSTKEGVTGQRRFGCLTITFNTRRLVTCGAIPRRVVSTSGNSGTGASSGVRMSIGVFMKSRYNRSSF